VVVTWPQLRLQAFLQRGVNNAGRIECEYGLGRMRTDRLLVWPIAGGEGKTQQWVIVDRGGASRP
jgi:hypothetical protein